MASPGEKNVFQSTERRHQDWIHGEFRELAIERIRRILSGWALLGRDVYGSVILGEIS